MVHPGLEGETVRLTLEGALNTDATTGTLNTRSLPDRSVHKVVVLLITGLNIDPVFKIVLDSWLSYHSITSAITRCSNKTVTVASEISLHALIAVASGAGIRALS
jgi:hypothetical protein